MKKRPKLMLASKIVLGGIFCTVLLLNILLVASKKDNSITGKLAAPVAYAQTERTGPLKGTWHYFFITHNPTGIHNQQWHPECQCFWIEYCDTWYEVFSCSPDGTDGGNSCNEDYNEYENCVFAPEGDI